MPPLKKRTRSFTAPICLLAVFAAWTAAVRFIDVRPIGPEGSSVGFAALNRWFHGLTGVHMGLYEATDLLSVIPFLFVAAFALLGLLQWIARKSLLKVDRSILVLGGYYIAVLAVFALFEVIAVNYRPILIEGVLEASYPSSTTMLVLCVMPTVVTELGRRLKNRTLRRVAAVVIPLFTLFMVAGRLISGVHWLTDIVGGMLLSGGLVSLYRAVLSRVEE